MIYHDGKPPEDHVASGDSPKIGLIDRNHWDWMKIPKILSMHLHPYVQE